MYVPSRMALVGRWRSFSNLSSFPLLPALWCGEAEDPWGDDGDARWEEPRFPSPQVDSHLPTLGSYMNERELPRFGGLFVTVKRITMTSTHRKSIFHLGTTPYLGLVVTKARHSFGVRLVTPAPSSGELSQGSPPGSKPSHPSSSFQSRPQDSGQVPIVLWSPQTG